MSIPAYPKIFALGQRHIRDILAGPVEVTEKLDGSQFAFASVDGELVCRSRGRVIPAGDADKLFRPAVETAQRLYDRGHLRDRHVFYGETLANPKHVTLTYGRVPVGHIALFAWRKGSDGWATWEELAAMAEAVGVEVAARLAHGDTLTVAELERLMEMPSALGGAMEGVVVKRINHEVLVANQILDVAAAKLVRPAFKETHRTSWNREHTERGRWDGFCAQFRSEARWAKAVQHLRERGELKEAPQDIGPLMAEAKRDIAEECKPEILEVLWREFGTKLVASAVKGLPEWYKAELAKMSEAAP